MGKISIFTHMNVNHAAYILRKMTPLFTLAGNYIYSPAHGSDGVYFLLVGAAEVTDLQRYHNCSSNQPMQSTFPALIISMGVSRR